MKTSAEHAGLTRFLGIFDFILFHVFTGHLPHVWKRRIAFTNSGQLRGFTFNKCRAGGFKLTHMFSRCDHSRQWLTEQRQLQGGEGSCANRGRLRRTPRQWCIPNVDRLVSHREDRQTRPSPHPYQRTRMNGSNCGSGFTWPRNSTLSFSKADEEPEAFWQRSELLRSFDDLENLNDEYNNESHVRTPTGHPTAGLQRKATPSLAVSDH